jgi:hypothetical protein
VLFTSFACAIQLLTNVTSLTDNKPIFLKLLKFQIMKTVLLVALLFFVSCERNTEKQLTADVVTSQADAQTFMSLAKDKEMFLQLSARLDLSRIEQVTGRQNVAIFMVRFKDDPNKIYAVNTLGNELLYSASMKDAKNGTIGILKKDEAITIEFKDGAKVIKDISNEQFESRFATDYHGGSGFCQREKGESFGACYKAESDEFCDSFISCVALATQPSVAIIIGLACSCNA